MSSGLVGHWKFNEKSGTTAYDSSRYKNNGTLTGGPKWGDKGIIFDGVNDYVGAGTDNSINGVGLNKSFTISGWINTGTYGDIINKWGAGGFRSYVLWVAGNGKLNGRVTSDGTNWTTITSTSLVNNSQWNHILFIYNGSKLLLYINGVSDATPVTHTSGIFNSTLNLRIGYFSAVAYFNGSIDEVRIYNRALSPLEIKRLHDSTKHKYI